MSTASASMVRAPSGAATPSALATVCCASASAAGARGFGGWSWVFRLRLGAPWSWQDKGAPSRKRKTAPDLRENDPESSVPQLFAAEPARRGVLLLRRLRPGRPRHPPYAAAAARHAVVCHPVRVPLGPVVPQL